MSHVFRVILCVLTLALSVWALSVGALSVQAEPLEVLGAASPSGLEDARALFARGAFAEAARKAETVGDAPALAFAARCLLADVVTAPPGTASLDEVKAAERMARAALDLDDRVVEAHVQLAVALGFRARAMGAFKARFKGLGREAKRHIDAAWRLAPDDPWVLSTLGGWHLEVVRRAGAKMAAWLYDADRETGLGAFEAALAVAPDNLSIHHQYVLMLLSFKDKVLYRQAGVVLERAAHLTPHDRVEDVARMRLAALRAAYRENDRQALKKLVERQRDLF